MVRPQGGQAVVSKPKNSKDALEFIHTLDSLAIKKQKDEIERLKAEVERLRKAGDNLERVLTDRSGSYEAGNASHEWNAAKEGKQS